MKTITYLSLLFVAFSLCITCNSISNSSAPEATGPSKEDNTYTVTLNSVELCGDPTLSVQFTVTSTKVKVPDTVTIKSTTDISKHFIITNNTKTTGSKGSFFQSGLSSSNGKASISLGDTITIVVTIDGADYTSTSQKTDKGGQACSGGNIDKSTK